MRERLFVKLSTIVMRIISKSFEVSARNATQRQINGDDDDDDDDEDDDDWFIGLSVKFEI